MGRPNWEIAAVIQLKILKGLLARYLSITSQRSTPDEHPIVFPIENNIFIPKNYNSPAHPEED
jgi:hypothetical protein